MDSPSSLFKLEQEIATLLIDKLKHLQITFDRAAQIARFVLQILPENLTDEQVEAIIPQLDDQFYELSEVVFHYIQEYEDKNKPIVIEEVNALVKEGKFDEAKKLMELYFQKITDNIIGK